MINGCKTLEEYIQRHQVDGVLWKASYLLKDVESPMIRHERTTELARTLSLITRKVAQDDYVKKLCKEHGLSPSTLNQLIQDSINAGKKKEQVAVHKNKVSQLEGNPRVWPFFSENTGKGDEYKGIDIDLEKFVALLASFGFTRYETGGEEDSFVFVRLSDNVIANVTRQQIIDHVENFIRKEYDFEGAGCRFTDSSVVINKFYKNMKSLFNKDLFARVRTPYPIVINRDTKQSVFFYYRNGFVEVTKDTWVLHPYSKLNGSVWDTQMLARDFKPMKDPVDFVALSSKFEIEDWGNFADFCWNVAGSKMGDEGDNGKRFFSLCSILGYLLHDFHDYKLRAILLTDSSMSDASEGRTGKTLLAKMIGFMRSFVELNGKDFDASNKNKYEDVKLGTQIIHLNDVKHKGRNKFDFEDVFNDVTEGIVVNAKYATPFRHNVKMIISTNKTLNIMGASQRDRIVEFEMGQFFGEHRSPQQHYGEWFGRDWDEAQWMKFDNFMCFCAACFLGNGILEADPINLGERKLRNHTDIAFLEFMDDVKEYIETKGTPFDGYEHRKLKDYDPASNDFRQFVFDLKQLHEKFKQKNTDFTWLTQRKFNEWLEALAYHRYGIRKAMRKHSHGISFFQFQPETDTTGPQH